MLDAGSSAEDSLWQDPAFLAALRRLGQAPVMLPGGLAVLRRRVLGVRLAMLPRASPPLDLADQLRAAGLHRTPLILSPERPGPLPRAFCLYRAQTVARLDLWPSIAARRAALHSKWRNRLRRAEAAGIEVSHAPLPPDPAHPLLLSEARQARTRGYANWPPALTAAFATTSEATRLFTAREGDEIVAQMLFLRHGSRATYHIGITTPRGRAHHAHNLLLWQASEWLAETGTLSLDLGPLDTRTPGLTRFKLRAGARPCPTGGTWLCWPPLARPGPSWSSAPRTDRGEDR
jgi:hypothetical protein